MAAVMYRGYLEKGSEVLGSRAEDCFVAQKPTKKQLNVKLIKKTRKSRDGCQFFCAIRVDYYADHFFAT
jgi:hypothetical protein